MKVVTEIKAHFLWERQKDRGFLSSENCSLLFRASFLQVETVSETSWNNIERTFYKEPFLISK